MRICLVTDRRRRPPVEQAAEAAAAGVDVIHVRERDLEAAELGMLVTAVVSATRGSSTKVVVNDRVDVAIACGADGVHLRGDSMPAVRVRRMTPDGFLIGRSVHSAEEASAAAAGADYLVAGTVFPTTSKPGHAAVLGLPGLSAIAHAVAVPVLAIGGVSVERASEVAGAGATGISAIGLFADPDRPIKEVVRLLRERFTIGGEIIPRT
jgi:thiamine-phosphate pyrophosphorylase